MVDLQHKIVQPLITHLGQMKAHNVEGSQGHHERHGMKLQLPPILMPLPDKRGA